MKRVYFCYPYRDNPRERTAEINLIIERLHEQYPEANFFYPHFAFPNWEGTFGRKYALRCTQDEVSRSDEMWIAYRPLSIGMKRDVKIANQLNIPVKDKTQEVRSILKFKILKKQDNN